MLRHASSAFLKDENIYNRISRSGYTRRNERILLLSLPFLFFLSPLLLISFLPRPAYKAYRFRGIGDRF